MAKKYYSKSLDTQVLVVASVNHDLNYPDWSAYIGAVKGSNHDRELMDVINNGSKLPYSLAQLIFPDLAEKYRWNQ